MAHQLARGNLRRTAKSPPTFKGGGPIGAAAPPDLTGLGAAPPPAMDLGGGGLPMGGLAGDAGTPPPPAAGAGPTFKPSDLVKRGRGKKPYENLGGT